MPPQKKIDDCADCELLQGCNLPTSQYPTCRNYRPGFPAPGLDPIKPFIGMTPEQIEQANRPNSSFTGLYAWEKLQAACNYTRSLYDREWQLLQELRQVRQEIALAEKRESVIQAETTRLGFVTRVKEKVSARDFFRSALPDKPEVKMVSVGAGKCAVVNQPGQKDQPKVKRTKKEKIDWDKEELILEL